MPIIVKALQKDGPDQPFKVVEIERETRVPTTSSSTLKLLESVILTFTPFATSGARRTSR